MVLGHVHNRHKADRQHHRLQYLDQQQHKCLAEHHRGQPDADRRLPQDDFTVLADFPVGVQRTHKRGHGGQNKERRAAADVDKVGGKAVGIRRQLDHQHHKRRLQGKAGQQQLIVPNQLQIALHQHSKLAQEP